MGSAVIFGLEVKIKFEFKKGVVKSKERSG